jgi:hypothetical protein
MFRILNNHDEGGIHVVPKLDELINSKKIERDSYFRNRADYSGEVSITLLIFLVYSKSSIQESL